MSQDNRPLAVSILVFAFSAFLLYITRSAAGALDTAAVALCGPLVGAVVAYFFHSQISGQTASLVTGVVAPAAAAAAGQPTTTQTGNTTVRTGDAATQHAGMSG